MTHKPVNIVYLMDAYVHPYGGTERQVYELIHHLNRNRFVPHMAVFRGSQYLQENDFECPVEVLEIGKIASFLSMWKLYRYVQELRSKQFSIVHIFFNDASIIAPPFLKWGGMRVIVSRRDMGFWCNAINSRLLRFNRIFVDRVVANSQAVKRSVQEKEAFSESKIDVIYNGFSSTRSSFAPDRKVKQELGISTDGAVIGIVANLREIKRIDDLIKAFAVVSKSHSDSWLVIVGTGELRDRLENLALSLGIRDRVIFAGQVVNVLPVIREFTVGVLCSESEGFSNSIIEYMSCGKPTVCTDVGGNTEIIQDGYNGFLVKVGDVNGLADRISKLLTNTTLTETLGKNALAMVNDKYDMGRMVDAHMDLYENLLLR